MEVFEDDSYQTIIVYQNRSDLSNIDNNFKSIIEQNQKNSQQLKTQLDKIDAIIKLCDDCDPENENTIIQTLKQSINLTRIDFVEPDPFKNFKSIYQENAKKLKESSNDGWKYCDGIRKILDICLTKCSSKYANFFKTPTEIFMLDYKNKISSNNDDDNTNNKILKI